MTTATLSINAQQVIDQTFVACDKIAAEYPKYAEVIADSKAGLKDYPSVKHAVCILESLKEMAEGTYED